MCMIQLLAGWLCVCVPLALGQHAARLFSTHLLEPEVATGRLLALTLAYSASCDPSGDRALVSNCETGTFFFFLFPRLPSKEL